MNKYVYTNTTSATCGAESGYRAESAEFTPPFPPPPPPPPPIFCGIPVARCLVFVDHCLSFLNIDYPS